MLKIICTWNILAHHDFFEKLKQPGINYSIIKPPATISAFVILLKWKKRTVNSWKAWQKQKSKYEGNLANICVDSIKQIMLH